MAIRLLIVYKEVGTFQVAKGLAFLQIAWKVSLYFLDWIC